MQYKLIQQDAEHPIHLMGLTSWDSACKTQLESSITWLDDPCSEFYTYRFCEKCRAILITDRLLGHQRK